MFKVKVKEGKIIISHGNLKVIKQKDVDVSHKAGHMHLSVANENVNDVYMIDICYCKEKDIHVLYVKSSCSEAKYPMKWEEQVTHEGLSIKLTGIYREPECI